MANAPSTDNEAPLLARTAAAKRALQALVSAIEREHGAGAAARPPFQPVLAILGEHAARALPPDQAPAELREALDLLEDLLDGQMRSQEQAQAG